MNVVSIASLYRAMPGRYTIDTSTRSDIPQSTPFIGEERLTDERSCTTLHGVTPSLDPKPVRHSRVEMTQIVLPGHTNQLGTIFGGQLMAWIDIAGSIASARHAQHVCVTASIDALHFVAPVQLGQHVRILACVNFTGRTSMEVGARIDSEEPTTGERSHVATAYMTFVAVDDQKNPRPVPPVVPETDDEKRRYRAAELRRESRLALKASLKPKSP
jgi:acyl-CoA hydrolase